jgi:hypothetical protein
MTTGCCPVAKPAASLLPPVWAAKSYMRRSIPMSGYTQKSPRASRFLGIIINDNDEKIWLGNMSNPINFPSVFGCYASKKTTNPVNEERYQGRCFLLCYHKIKTGNVGFII